MSVIKVGNLGEFFGQVIAVVQGGHVPSVLLQLAVLHQQVAPGQQFGVGQGKGLLLLHLELVVLAWRAEIEINPLVPRRG